MVIIWRRGEGFTWNLTSKVKGVKEFWKLMDKEVGGSWKLDNFHGRHMCIIPYLLNLNYFQLIYTNLFEAFICEIKFHPKISQRVFPIKKERENLKKMIMRTWTTKVANYKWKKKKTIKFLHCTGKIQKAIAISNCRP